MDVAALGASEVLRGPDVDATASRERARQRRLLTVVIALGTSALWLWYRVLDGRPVGWGWPRLPDGLGEYAVSFGLMFVLILIIGVPLLMAGRSPHVTLRPVDSGIRLSDVVGAEATRREAVRTLNLFLAHRTFATEMGGSPRRGVLFEGPPGTGKTYLAKAMAGEAGVPFLFVSASAFQSMYYGQTNRKIRSYFAALRKAARREGGAIGFIEEFDAIGASRSGLGPSGVREGVTGVVNELLVQMQSFDVPTGWARFQGRLIDAANRYLPAHRQLPRPVSAAANVLLVAATNRAGDLDPALLRPGRFDRIIGFSLPPRADREAIAEYYLARKAHGGDVNAAAVATVTAAYTPVQIERLLDEALVCALREGRRHMVWSDVLDAKLVTELGVSQNAVTDPAERRRIATHEAGHAVAAHLVGRSISVVSVLRRSGSLGLVAHTDEVERSVHTAADARALVQIALAGMVAEQMEYGGHSSGVAADLEAATNVAAQVVGALGLGGSRISLEAALMPGAGNLVAKVLADDKYRAAADRLINEAENDVRRMLAAHRTALLALAAELAERDELPGAEVQALLTRHGSPAGSVCPS